MTLDELGAKFRRLNLPASAYSLGRDANESYCLVVGPDGWHVYYSERGNRNSEEVLPSESEACRRLLERVLHDGSVRRWMDDRGA
ncbi:hypothetical protein ACTHAM_003272 [Cellulomonas soli]|uniref:hypothetical protein n=1 Tax=Cellulomonas soli TaxID=931535 RepID=UPI003F85586A